MPSNPILLEVKKTSLQKEIQVRHQPSKCRQFFAWLRP